VKSGVLRLGLEMGRVACKGERLACARPVATRIAANFSSTLPNLMCLLRDSCSVTLHVVHRSLLLCKTCINLNRNATTIVGMGNQE